MQPLIHLLKNLAFILFLAAVSLVSSCKEEDDMDNPFGLPDPTRSGENTFGCLVNGVPWIAEISVFAPGLHEITSSYDEVNTGIFYDNNWNLSTTHANNTINKSFVFTANNFQNIGLLKPIENNLQISFRPDSQAFNVYRFDHSQVFTIEITKLDTSKNICSGLFDFFLLSTDESDTLHITEGRFDVSY